MIQIYSVGNETFTKNGDAVLWCYSCNLSVELNGTWYIDLTAPIDKEGRWKLITEEAVLKVPTFQEDEQLYRIKKVTKTDTVIQAVAFPIFYDSADDAFLLDVRPTNKTGQQALDIMCAGTPYSGESNISTVNTAYFVRRNLLNAINGNDDPTFISRWGGEIFYDNYKVIINTRVGGNYGMEARYGRNINGVTYIVDTSELVTRIVPVAFNGHTMSGSSPWVDSVHINAYAKVYTKEMVFENIRMAADASGAPDDAVICNNQQELEAALTAAAQAEFATGIDTPVVTMDLDMAMITNMASEYTEPLQDSDGGQIQDNYGDDIESVWYREYATLEKVRLGDTVRCRDSRIDVSSTSRVIALTWDCITKKVVHVTLGDFQFNYMKNLSQTMNRVKNVLADDGSLVAERVKGFLDGSQTQLRTQYNLATRQDTMAILFENLDEDSPMYGALGIGTQGICISKTRTADGRDWDWTTGITANGLNTGMGVFGLLTDKTGTNWWNLDTGEFVMGGGSTIGGKTISQYMADAHNELAAYEASNDAVIADIQAQLDGAIETYFEDYTPTLNNYPANEWTTTALKEEHEGDLFYNKSDGNSYRFFNNKGTWEWTLITDTVAAEALSRAAAAQDTADGKRRVFVSQPVVPYDRGDLWYNGSGILVCTTAKTSSQSYAAADWTSMTAYASSQAFSNFLTEYALDISGLEADIDDRIQTYSQITDPSTSWPAAEKPKHAGDLWYNLNDGKTYRYSGSAWSEVTTTPPSSVITAINDKATIFTTQPTPPYSVGDLWFNSSTSDIMTCVTARSSGNYTASDWEKRNKYTDDSALNAYKAEMETITGDLQNQIDGKIQTWRQASDPSINWTGQDEGVLQDHAGLEILDEMSAQITTTRDIEKLQHTGDLWQNISDNTEWRWTGSGWEEMAVPDALIDKVDGKRTIYSSQPVPPYEERDLWCEGGDGDIKICVHARAYGESYDASDWTLASKYTDDSGLLEFIDGDYARTITELQEQADGKAETWYQSTDPSLEWQDPETRALHKGDLWYKTTDSTTWYYTGSSWTQMDIPQDVFDTIDSKAQIFATQPTGPYYKNDLWYTGTVVKVCIKDRATGFSAADWEKKDYYTDDTELQNFITDTYTPAIVSMQNELDGKIETWHQSSDPSIHWTRKETDVVLQDHTGADLLDSSGQQILTDRNIEKYEHTGDIWKDTTDNTEYMYSGDGWIVMDAPDELYDLVDGKSTVFTTSTTPTGAQERDLWFRGPDYPIYTFINGGWTEYNKYTSDENLDEFVDVTFTPWKRETDRNVQTILTNLDGEIIAAVIDGDIINAINISSEGIAINASKLNINGVTSINNGFKVKTDGSFEANSGLIGKIHVTTTSIYSGSHSSYNSSSQGFYLGSDGKFGIGNSSNYMRWDGSTLSLNVNSLSIGGNTAATQGYASDTATNAKNQAISTAASDATTKANNAKSQAISTAAADATTKANNAISTAAADATSKANNAISTAAADATTKADNAKTQAISAAAADATSKANEAAKTATNYLYYDSSVGLVVSTDGTNYASSYNTRVKADGIRFYNKTNLLGELTGTALKFYYNGTERMQLNSSGINFYKPDGITVAASVTTDGFILGTGTIAGFTFGTDSIKKGAISAANSVVVSSGSSEYASIGGSAQINGWAFTAGTSFGVTKGGVIYASSGKINGINIGGQGIYSGSKTSYNTNAAGFCLETNGNFGIGDANSHVYYWSSNGKSHLDIKADTITISGSTAATQTYASGEAASARDEAIDAAASDATKKANNAKSDAISAAASDATTKANNAAKTATNYLYYNSATGLVVSPNGTSYSSGYNTRVQSDGIRFYSGSSILGELTGTELKFYYSGTQRMKLNSSGITFYKPDGSTTAASVTTKGFVLGTGTIAGFTFESNSIYNGTLGSADSVYISPGSSGSADIAGSGSISGWAFAAGTGFGVTKAGKMYANSGKINGVIIGDTGIHSDGKKNYNANSAGFCLENNGNFGIGDANSHVYYWYSDNTSHLEIKADTIMIGGSTAATQTYASGEATSAKNEAIDAAAADATTKANNAKREAISTASSDATSKSNAAAKTATNYLHYSFENGLIVSPNGSGYTSGYNTRVQSDGIRFYNGDSLLSELTGSDLKFYYNGSARMVLSENSLKFYEPSGTLASFINNNGLNVNSGKIANFTINSTKFSCGKFEIIPEGTSKTINKTSRSNIVLYSNGNFGVSTNGDLYAYSGTIGGWTIESNSIKTDNIRLESWKTDGGTRISLGSSWQFYISGNGNAVLNGIAGESIGAHYSAGNTGFGVDQSGLDCNVQALFNSQASFASAVYMYGMTAGTGINVVFGTGGRLYYTSSSKRYKDIDRKLTDADIAKAYDINTYRAKYKDGILDKDDQMNGVYMPMLIAEEVAKAVPEAAIIRDGKVEDWNHRVLIPVMFQMLKSQKEEIEELRSLINQKGIA